MVVQAPTWHGCRVVVAMSHPAAQPNGHVIRMPVPAAIHVAAIACPSKAAATACMAHQRGAALDLLEAEPVALPAERSHEAARANSEAEGVSAEELAAQQCMDSTKGCFSGLRTIRKPEMQHI